ncbi:MAG: SH3 domain-containing protein [Pseudomonadota bacterium]
MNRAGRTDRVRPGPAALMLVLAALATGPVLAADNATVARDTQLREKPLNDAPVVAELKAKAAVSVNSRNGAWAHVSTAGGKSGFVRLLNLRTSSGQKGESGVGALASVFKTGSSGSSVSTGVKGLSEEDLTGAEANDAEVEKLAAFKAADKEARDGARLAGLKAKPVDYLLAPEGSKKKKKKKDRDEEE